MALALALAAAAGYGFASVLQALAARSQSGTVATLMHPAYLAGTTLDLLAFLTSLVALRSLPVYEVQGVLATSLAITALVARAVLGSRLRRVDLLAIGVTMAALAALAASSGGQQAASLPGAGRYLLALAAVPVAGAGWLAVRAVSAPVCGALAGLAFGGAALCARALRVPVHPLADLPHTLAVFVTDPLLWALAGFGVTGMLLYAFGLEHGNVGSVTALLWITEVVVPSVLGVVLLHDTVRPGWIPIAGAAVVATVAAAGVLATSPASAGPDRASETPALA